MKRIIPRIIVMLTGVLILIIGIAYNLPLAMGAGFFVFFFALTSIIEADHFNRSRWNRLINYYVKERDGRIASEMKCELSDIEREELEMKLKDAEEKPSMVYIGGPKYLRDALNKVHAPNFKRMSENVQTVGSLLETEGREINEREPVLFMPTL